MEKTASWIIFCFVFIMSEVLTSEHIWMDDTIKCLKTHAIYRKLPELHTQKLTDQQENCVDACMFQSLGLMNADGAWDKEKSLTVVHGMTPNRYDEIVRECNKDSVGNGVGIEKSCKVIECIKTNQYFDEFHIRSPKSSLSS